MPGIRSVLDRGAGDGGTRPEEALELYTRAPSHVLERAADAPTLLFGALPLVAGS